MSTLRDLVSSVQGMNKLFSADNKITQRVIAAEIKSAALMLIKQQTDKRKLWQSPNLFTRVTCIELIEVPLSECCDYRNPCTIRRSKKKIPKIAEGLFGLLIQGVYNINTSYSYDYASPNRYANLLKLGLKNKQYFYWIHNDYLYITDSNTEFADLFAYFEDDIPTDLSACQTADTSCISPLDREFKMPGYLENNLKAIVYDSLMKTYFRRLQDYTPDGKDEQR